MKEVAVNLVEVDDVQAVLMSVDENLRRSEYTPAERLIAFGTRKAAYETMHPEKRAGVAGGKGRQGTGSDAKSFAKATAEAIGQSDRTVRRATEQFAKIGQEPLARIVGTKLDDAGELNALAKLDRSLQAELVERAARNEAVSAKDVLKSVQAAASAPAIEGEEPEDFLREPAQDLADEFPQFSDAPFEDGPAPDVAQDTDVLFEEPDRWTVVGSSLRAAPPLVEAAPARLGRADAETALDDFRRGARERLDELAKEDGGYDVALIATVRNDLDRPQALRSAEMGAVLAEAYLDWLCRRAPGYATPSVQEEPLAA